AGHLLDENDHVRLEIEAAFRQGKPVIPILVEDARMPAAGALPETLRPLRRRQAVRIAHATFERDLDSLVRSLGIIENARPPVPTPANANQGEVRTQRGSPRREARKSDLSARNELGIFMSYRRSDTTADAGRLYDALRRRFGRENLFMDVDHLRPDLDSVDVIEAAVAPCDVLLAVIGPDWVSATDAEGRSRLENENDRVRLEIEAALRSSKPVIPVLFEDAAMPRASALPDSLRPLLRRHAIRIAHATFERDLNSIVRAVRQEAVPRRESAERPTPATASAWRIETDNPLRAPAEPAIGIPHDPVSAVNPGPLPRAFARSSPSLLSRLGDAIRAFRPLDQTNPKSTPIPTPVIRVLGPADRDRLDDLVDCSVHCPPQIAPGAAILVQIWANRESDGDESARLATLFDPARELRAIKTLGVRVPVGSRLDFELRAPPLRVEAGTQSMIWRGRPQSVAFELRAPVSTSASPIIGTVAVMLDTVPLGHLKFRIDVVADPLPATQGDGSAKVVRRYRSAFVSYASPDRDPVLARVQMLTAMGVPYFQDVLSLRSGERWESSLYERIEACDLFLLFWSSHARESEWVRREVGYALRRQAGDELNSPEIRPVIIEGPPIPRPWPELSHLHFNDIVLSQMSSGAARPHG
ncbi:MAG: toll/interleukin-1 receptor domain-containing protein, partial [Chloroflexota bacterium]